jgi:hypothetical protein
MPNKLKHFTDKELQAYGKKILNRCESWKDCQDGSYEMALHQRGYTEVQKEIEYRERQEM